MASEWLDGNVHVASNYARFPSMLRLCCCRFTHIKELNIRSTIIGPRDTMSLR